jgi:hypothetical protein
MSSMSRKVLEKTNGDPLQFEDFCAAQGDWLRYTMLIDTDSYVSGVELTTAVLAKKGIKEKKMKNFWRKTGEETDYMGINAIYITKQGFPFELQFHTPETLDTKMQRCHHSYEKFREESSIDYAYVPVNVRDRHLRGWSKQVLGGNDPHVEPGPDPTRCIQARQACYSRDESGEGARSADG